MKTNFVSTVHLTNSAIVSRNWEPFKNRSNHRPTRPQNSAELPKNWKKRTLRRGMMIFLKPFAGMATTSRPTVPVKPSPILPGIVRPRLNRVRLLPSMRGCFLPNPLIRYWGGFISIQIRVVLSETSNYVTLVEGADSKCTIY